MKKSFAWAGALFAVLILVLFTGCPKPDDIEVKALASISVTKNPDKTDYFLGEQLDTTGMEVTATYDDNSTEVVTEWTTSGFDSSAVNDNLAVEVSYTKDGITKKTSFTVTVKELVYYYPSEVSGSSFDNSTKYKVIIDEGVTSISGWEFCYCTGLTEITIPASVTSIGDSAFCYCSNLTKITVSPDNKVYDSRNDCNAIIKTETNALIAGCNNTVIPDSVTSIGSDAFYGCTGLTEIMIPDSVTSIGSRAFHGCTGLTNITISDSVTSIGDSAFSYCSGLTKITVSPGNKVYDSRNDCNAIIETETDTLIAGCNNTVIPDSVCSIADGAFSGCTEIMELTIPESTIFIGADEFSGCKKLRKIIIPASVTSIGNNAFGSCTELVQIIVSPDNKVYDSRDNCNAIIETETNTLIAGCKNTVIPDTVTSIDKYAFFGCKGLTGITIPDSVTSIGWQTFSYCTGLTEITIPNSVTSIDKYAFSGCTGLTSIIIPDSVTSIGWDAFSGCTGLTEITIPFTDNLNSIFGNDDWKKTIQKVTLSASVTSIGSSVFSGCTGLTEITIPDSVTTISGGAFSYCSNLTKITVSPDNEVYDSRNDCNAIIEKETNTLIAGCKNTVIPDTVTSIGESAFSGCTGLTEITIPASVTSIGGSAFSVCTGLTEITIPASVTSISGWAFFGCTGLTSITIPASVTSIGWGAFSGCTGLTEITIPDSVTSIGWRAFSGCTGLTEIIIPDSVTSIDSGAFSGCTGLTEVTLPVASNICEIFGNTWEGVTVKKITLSDSVTSIENGAFEDCTGLAEVVIPASVTSIGESAFSGCKGLTEITIPSSVTSIGESAFSGCTGLTEVTLPVASNVCSIFGNEDDQGHYTWEGVTVKKITLSDSVTSIEYGAFEDCTGLAEVVIPASVTSIGGYVFAGCSSLSKITVSPDNKVYDSRNDCNAIIETETNTLIAGCICTVIPDTVTSIGDYAFSGCTELTEITLSDAVTSIGAHAFADCKGLTGITLPDTVTSIGDYAFSGCTELTEITLSDTVTSIGAHAFADCKGLTEIKLPDTVSSIGKYAFADCTELKSITLPDKISIGQSAFQHCSCTIYLKGTVNLDYTWLFDYGILSSGDNLKVVYPTATLTESDGISKEYLGPFNLFLKSTTDKCQSLEIIAGSTYSFTKGDKIKVTFRGTSDKDISQLFVNIVDLSPYANNWMQIVEIADKIYNVKADEPFEEELIFDVVAAPVEPLDTMFHVFAPLEEDGYNISDFYITVEKL